MSQEYILNVEVDLNQEGGKRLARASERYLIEHEFVVNSRVESEDWSSLSFKTSKSLSSVRKIQNYLLITANKMDVRLSSEIVEFTPQILIGLIQLEKHAALFENLNVNKGRTDAEISFSSTRSRDDFLEFLQNEGIPATSYFSEKSLDAENKSNFATTTNTKKIF